MHETALYVIRNLLSDVEKFGFVPNGGRIYYLDRSQPPLLSDMLMEYVQTTGNVYLIHQYIFVLDSEYKFWNSTSSTNAHVVTITLASGNFTLNRYYANDTSPRPESYREDIDTALSASYISEHETLYRHIRSAAESGWDFSSRWIREAEGGYNLTHISTCEIVPVDLNAVLYQMERNLARMHQLVALSLLQLPNDEDSEFTCPQALEYLQRSHRRKQAMTAVLWDDQSYLWRDYNLTANACTNINTISNFIPLAFGLADDWPEPSKLRVWESLESSRLLQRWGPVTTTIGTGQQWDSPNAWAPLTWLTIEGLEKLRIPPAKTKAAQVAEAWLETCFTAYNITGFMFEKYNAFQKGIGGGGGEYQPQTGFGWSNGVVLSLLYRYCSNMSTQII